MALVFSQMQAQFDEMKKAAVDALRTIFPVEGKLRSVVMEKAWVDDSQDPTDYSGQQKARNTESTWGVPVYAHLKLVDKMGHTVDENPKVKLFTLPKPTQRHSFIVGGNEYQVHNQLRLKPGVYTIRKQNGELKTQINLAKGKNFDLNFDENKGVFNIQKIGGGQANIPLYPVLLYLGISRGDVSRAWGDKLAASNEAFSDPKAVERLEAALKLGRGQTAKSYLDTTVISPETTKAALGKGFDRVDGPLLLASSKKLLNVHLGKEEPTDRDSLEYKELHGIDDYIRERLEKNKQTLSYRIKRSVDNLKRDKISQIVNQGAFTSTIESFFAQDDKATTPEQTNPLEMLSGTQKVTFMGAGGIGSTHAITNEMRQIHPSHLGLIDPVHTPSSDRIGVNLHLPLGAVKDGKELKTRVVDKSGKEFFLSPVEMKPKKIGLPDESGSTVRAMYEGHIVEVPRSEVDYFIPSAANLFSYSANLIPFLPSAQGNRAQMASKMLEQAISLKHREAPLVQTQHPDGKTFESVVGEYASLKSPVDGKVARVGEDKLTINSSDGKTVEINLYNNFALNRKSFIHHYPSVKAGDDVKKGQVIADSNYTRNGVLALGANMKTGYLSFRGLNFDDGIVISETASQRLTSEHVYTKDLAIFPNTVTGLGAFRVFYPTTLTPKNLAKLDSDGVIKKGEKISHGEAYIVALQKRGVSVDVSLVSKVLSERPKDASMYWTLEDTGVVIDVMKSDKKITVVIKTEEAAKIGDKLAGRHGNKGVITGIIPDHEMPKTKDGPLEVLMSPMGIISRINVSQTYESAMGKVVSKTGSAPYVVNNFDGTNYLQAVKGHMEKAGVDDKEEVFDGETGKSLGQVHVGVPHILKLFKQSQGNFSVRQGGPGSGYDANMQPLKAGGEEGSKSMDVLTMYSMLSHGARENLREMAAVKSTKNDEFWKALKAGEQLPPPQTSFAYNKFIGYLKGAGVDVRKQGTQLMLAPFTDDQVKATSKGEITKPLFFRGKDLAPIKGGFFDTAKLGGFRGEGWGHVALVEPVVNPPFENAVRKLTGLGTKFDDVMSGKLHLDEKGSLNKDGVGVTGGAAIEKILKGIDVDTELKSAIAKAQKAKASQLDDLNKKIRYLQSLKTLGLRPEEAYIRRFLPVVPPTFRPVYPLPDGNITTADANILYQNVGVVNTMMKAPVMDLLHEKDKAAIREDLYEHVKGVSGVTDMNIKGKERSGFISEIKGGAGGQPKEGFFISKLLSKRQDYVGRGTALPDPSLGVDQVAIPEAMAWKLFEPFIVRELRAHGKTPTQALEEIKNKTSLAKRALELVMEKRHVLLNRAPSLHKFSIMALKPVLTDGKSVKVQPLINKGLGMDFDGDTVVIHAPISDNANKEAEKMLPSRNLFQPGSGNLMLAPSQEAQLGVYYLSQTEEGRKKLHSALGDKYPVTKTLDKKATAELLKQVAKDSPQEYGGIVRALKDLGERELYLRGSTIGVEDIVDLSAESKKIVAMAKKKMGESSDPAQTNLLMQGVADHLIKLKLEGKNNPFYDQITSGAKGDASQLRSILVSPMFMADAKSRVVPLPISKSYAAGLTSADYWVSAYGARKGLMDTAISTSLPGAFSKDIMATVVNNVVSMSDCGTRDGVELPVTSNDCLERFTSDDQHGLPRNTLVDRRVLDLLHAKSVTLVKVRSPLKCKAKHGICGHCYGLDEHGHVPEIGENVGAKSGQTISEPLVQMLMKSKHTGGVAGTGSNAGGYARITQLLSLPKTLAGAATLSPVDGKVTKITKGLAGGYDVLIGDKKAHIVQGNTPTVEVGQDVRRGDALSTGPIKPQDLAAAKDMSHAQDYLTDELQKTYKGQGVGVSRKTFETVVKSLTNSTQILNKPKHADFLPGDVAPLSVVDHYNSNLVQDVSVEEAEGDVLDQDYGLLKSGRVLSARDVNTLRAAGIHRVKVRLDPIQHKPFVKGMSSVPLLRQDWMAALGYRNLAKVLTEGASQGWKTDVENYHPIPALAYGTTFGQGKEGRY